MMINLFKTLQSIQGKILLCSLAFLVIAGCASPPKSADYPQVKPVDAKAQQRYYDLGLQQYSDENFGKAKESFQQVIEYGPNTGLGLKAQENLKKIERILKTLEEIEAK
jgi:TolA-binding protein